MIFFLEHTGLFLGMDPWSRHFLRAVYFSCTDNDGYMLMNECGMAYDYTTSRRTICTALSCTKLITIDHRINPHHRSSHHIPNAVPSARGHGHPKASSEVLRMPPVPNKADSRSHAIAQSTKANPVVTPTILQIIHSICHYSIQYTSYCNKLLFLRLSTS